MPVGRALAAEARLLCFDEFQVSDIADAMILGRLFEQLFAAGTVIVATSNVAPARLYEGGLNRQLFLPFIAEIKQRLDVVELMGVTDYRLQRLSGVSVYLTPLSPQADAAMDAAWLQLTGCAKGTPCALTVLGRKVPVPQAARGVARFSFHQLCEMPLAAPDYLAIAREFHTLLIDHIPRLEERNEARRFVTLIDTLYDEGVKLICSAAGPPEALYPAGDGAEAFRRTASRLAEMQSEDYLKRGHGVHGVSGLPAWRTRERGPKSVLENVYWACAFVLAGILIYRFGVPWMQRFDEQNRRRIVQQEQDKSDPTAHIRHTLEMAEEQVEPITEIKVGNSVQYLFEAELFLTRDDAEAKPALSVSARWRGVFMPSCRLPWHIT